jgi:hypothetical protein
MTIKYANGRTIEAVLLSRDDHAIRAAVQGGEDAMAFTCVNGTWVSEDCEAVELQFEWQRHAPKTPPSVGDCICPKELADRLIQALFGGYENELMAAMRPARRKAAADGAASGASGLRTVSAMIH